jgi:hypothetical protein
MLHPDRLKLKACPDENPRSQSCKSATVFEIDIYGISDLKPRQKNGVNICVDEIYFLAYFLPVKIDYL